jgi:hypothetical protein
LAPFSLWVVVRPRSSTAARETAEQTLARIAGASHGVVTSAQALRAGLTRGEIKHRLRTGALLREHQGVYRVGHRAPHLEARYMAAVRACGDGALLRGRPAGFLFGLLKGTVPPPEVLTSTHRRVPGVATKRTRHVHPEDATTWRGVPVTTVSRTLVDLAAVLGMDDMARICHEAAVIHGTTPIQVEDVLARRPNSPGAGALRKVLRGDAGLTLSALERRFVALLREAGLALPEMNRPVGRRMVDCRWPEECVTVELDGYRYHSSRYAWEQDRRREREAYARGDAFRRYTYGDVFDDPTLMLSELRALIPARCAA